MVGWLNGNVLVVSLFARGFGQKIKFMARHSKANIFYDPKWTRPKDNFLTRLHVAVFHERRTDQKRTVIPIDPCYSCQKGRWFGWPNGGDKVDLFRARFGPEIDF